MTEFLFDVFLSHSAKDKTVVLDLAVRLKTDGISVWLDDWEILPGDNIPAKIEYGLENSRLLLLCMSANAFGSDWVQLESQTFRFRDPLNKGRRLIPLRLDEVPVKGSLVQLSYIDWRVSKRDSEYQKLFAVCRGLSKAAQVSVQPTGEHFLQTSFWLKNLGETYAYAFDPVGKLVLSGGQDRIMQLRDLQVDQCLRQFQAHSSGIYSLAWSADQAYALCGSFDGTIRLLDVGTERCLRVFGGHTGDVYSLAWSPDQDYALSGSNDKTMRLWKVATGGCIRVFKGHTAGIWGVGWSNDQCRALSVSDDKTMRLWEIKSSLCLRVFKGHTGSIYCVTWSADQNHALSGSYDQTLRLWNVSTGYCLRVFEGHTNSIVCLAWHNNQRLALSGSYDNTLRLWDISTGECLSVFKGHVDYICSVSWSTDGNHAYSGDKNGNVRIWDLSEFVNAVESTKHSVTLQVQSITQSASLQAVGLHLEIPEQVQYTNAKVLLVGDSGAGKTGLSLRLTSNDWQASDSTVGAWATQWQLPLVTTNGVEREIWLWDFGGQADQRLIHSLYMDDSAVAVLVFDGQKEHLFSSLSLWDRDLTRSSGKSFKKLLVAGRVDAGGLRVSRLQLDNFCQERDFIGYLETSAKENDGCEQLREAIIAAIPWDELTKRSSPRLFKRLKEEIVKLKDDGRVLLRFNELRETLQLRLLAESLAFSDDELQTVLGLLVGPGVVWQLAFGSWVLLQPEAINAYAQTVIQTLRLDEMERGCLPEERVLNGQLSYHATLQRLAEDEERFVLLAMHQTLVERGLCWREHTQDGTFLVFPSFYRRERPELIGHPSVWVSYRFTGFLDEIYATLVVRLHFYRDFANDQLWHDAADFRTTTSGNKQLGIKLNRQVEGVGELLVYFDPAISSSEKIIFSRYVHEHLLQNARDVERLRHYVCPHCGTSVENRGVAMRRLNDWLDYVQPVLVDEPSIVCVGCEQRVPLWDELEQCFASAETQQRVRILQELVNRELDNESKERALVGEVISTVALAGQLSRELTVSDHGIDMEIEFKNDKGEATARKLYLQLKSGDSYLRGRKRDGKEVFHITKPRHAEYWMAQAFPVFLVIRNSKGEVRWMEVRDWLKKASNNGAKPVKEIVFEAERFDVMSVWRWRERVLKDV